MIRVLRAILDEISGDNNEEKTGSNFTGSTDGAGHAVAGKSGATGPARSGMIPGFMRGTTQPASTTISPATSAQKQGRWVRKAPLPIPRTEMTWAAVWDNKMYVIGGYNYKGGQRLQLRSRL